MIINNKLVYAGPTGGRIMKRRIITVRHFLLRTIGALTALLMVSGVQGATVWTGPDVIFTKDNFADWTQPANQDFLTSNVILTRGDKGSLCNFAASDPCDSEGGSPFGPFPSDTEWAIGDLADWSILTYNPSLHNLTGSMPNFTLNTYVAHLITDDIYLSVEGLQWTSGSSGGAGFSYSRSTAVPVPAAVWLFGSALGLLGWIKRKAA
jgi:hypothetical protein